MKFNTKYFTPDGVEVCVYGAELMNITQGMFEGFSHKGRATIDEAGPDNGISRWALSFRGKITWKQVTGDKTGILVSSINKVWVPKNGGTRDYVNIILWHDNDISDLWVGKIIEAGVPFYDEGTAGFATGNHIHLGVSLGKYNGGYPMYENSDGNWEIYNEEKVYDVFYINDTKIKNDESYPWKTYVAAEKPNVVLPNLKLDGMWGKEFQKAFQTYFKIYADGIMSGQIKSVENQFVYAAVWGKGGSYFVKVLQQHLGLKNDGYFGPTTIKELQKFVGVPQTGRVLSKNDPMVLAIQKKLNEGTFTL